MITPELQVSIVLTTYNWPQALEASLHSVLAQTRPPLEIIVADDGSTQATAEVVRRVQAQAGVKIVHSWQEDKGFRLAKSRNKAIARARGGYIILIDGDIILERHFVEDHCSSARRDCFVQGTRVLLNQELSTRILETGRVEVGILTPGVQNHKNCLRSPLLARLCSWRSRRIKGIKTCNFAFWKEDAVRINGFNEEFIGWGREDSEFTARLLNSGVRRQNLKFFALGYHLFHPMNTRARLAINDRILHETIASKSVWCSQGIDQYLG
ncbi:glycosyltransferase family 2 protein [Desulfogranum mediterraneum]|uniref:glycosyltransferase family 2 protein n=1 Tax=Desulfogranum mediterraneum TaxID=160661 RepID=UPI00040939FC|nr:glycosyltransferase family 2 protein [Desulfogranum mediterraneum]